VKFDGGIMDKELRQKLIKQARENGAKHGKTAELDFGAGAEWMYQQLQNKSSNSDYTNNIRVSNSYLTLKRQMNHKRWLKKTGDHIVGCRTRKGGF
jgi:hypothetical protein